MGASVDKTAIDDIAVKKTAVRILHGVCDVVLGGNNAFTETLSLTLKSANAKTFEHNYRVAELEFRRLPAEVVELVVGKCNSHIASNRKLVLGQIRTLSGREPVPAKPAAKRQTAVDWL
jgi:hypothetical protein